MVRAYADDVLVAASDDTVVVEGNHYFPRDSVDSSFLRDSDMTTSCHWKGQASYYHVEAGDSRFENAAFYYPEPSEAAAMIKDRIAFWQGIRVEEE